MFVPPGSQVFKATDDRPVDIEVVGSDLVFAPGYTYAIEILEFDADNAALESVMFCPLACVVQTQPQVLLSVWPVVKARSDAAAAPLPRERRRNPLVLSLFILTLEYCVLKYSFCLLDICFFCLVLFFNT